MAAQRRATEWEHSWPRLMCQNQVPVGIRHPGRGDEPDLVPFSSGPQKSSGSMCSDSPEHGITLPDSRSRIQCFGLSGRRQLEVRSWAPFDG
jgi:hypothetical protein